MQKRKFISVDADANKNRHWTVILHDNSDVETRWARVGDSEQSKVFVCAGQKFFDKKIAEKIRKGYKELEIVGETQKKEIVSSNILVDLAIKQICGKNKDVEPLVKFLAESNIHHITSNTLIEYDKSTGLFSTPLGIVSQKSISEARNLLVKIIDNKKEQVKETRDKLFKKYVSEYLMLIPHVVSRKFDAFDFFPNTDAVFRQNDLLDSLQSSLDIVSRKPDDTDSNGIKEENIFDVQIKIASQDILEYVNNLFLKTRKDMHESSRFKVSKVYDLNLGFMRDRFLDSAEKMELWHGTGFKNILSILKSGLNISPPSSVSIAGKNFGNGIYFALDSTKSLNYAAGVWRGTRENKCFMFLADVNLGKFFVPKSTTSSNPPVGYDSYWAKKGQSGSLIHDEIVVFDERRYDLKYLVEFE